jgi:hypothetical protein
VERHCSVTVAVAQPTLNQRVEGAANQYIYNHWGHRRNEKRPESYDYAGDRCLDLLGANIIEAAKEKAGERSGNE